MTEAAPGAAGPVGVAQAEGEQQLQVAAPSVRRGAYIPISSYH